MLVINQATLAVFLSQQHSTVPLDELLAQFLNECLSAKTVMDKYSFLKMSIKHFDAGKEKERWLARDREKSLHLMRACLKQLLLAPKGMFIEDDFFDRILDGKITTTDESSGVRVERLVEVIRSPSPLQLLSCNELQAMCEAAQGKKSNPTELLVKL